jgi:hypothetical protein
LIAPYLKYELKLSADTCQRVEVQVTAKLCKQRRLPQNQCATAKGKAKRELAKSQGEDKVRWQARVDELEQRYQGLKHPNRVLTEVEVRHFKAGVIAIAARILNSGD